MLKRDFDTKRTVFLIDGSSFLYRAYYSLPPMHSKAGQPVQVVYGFCRMVKKLVNQFKPAYCGVVWDPGPERPTIRHEIYIEYKAQRQSAPSELHDQRGLVKEFASIIGLHQDEEPGIEADDILYSCAVDFSKQGYTVIIVTSDKDMRQCVSEKILIYDPFKNEIIDAPAIELRYGIPLSKLVFYFALIGDSVDNIPGVKGVGPKTAQELVNKCESLADLYANLDRVERKRVQELLEVSRDQAFLSEKLFALNYYTCHGSPESYAFDEKNWFNAREFFKLLDFASLLKDFPPEPGPRPGEENIAENSLDVSFVTVTTVDQLRQLCDLIRQHRYCALDTETDSLKSLQSTLVGISLCVELGTTYYIPLCHNNCPQQLDYKTIFTYLGPLLADPSIKKYLHNTKFDQLVLSRADGVHGGFELKGVEFDTLIAAHLITKEGQRLSLKWLSEFYLNQRMLTFDEVVTKQKLKNFAEVPIDKATQYAGADAHQTLALKTLLQKELDRQEQNSLFYGIEMPLINVLYKMEKEGVIVDTAVLDRLSVEANAALQKIEAEIHAVLPDGCANVNLNAPRQLEDLLFNVLKLSPLKKTTHKTGYSTDHEVLSELAKVHPVPALILKYREVYKVKSTYLDALKTAINPQTGRIHTSYSQTGTATGRLASSDPNLQNIPTGTAAGSLPIRSAFKAPEGHHFLSADYSQIELRVLAYVSQDKNLMKAFLERQDIHAQTAAGLFDIAPDKVQSEQRALAKRINFSILYGLSPYGLSKDLGIPYKEAELYIKKYFAQYPGVVAWMEGVVEFAKKHGYVQTLWGRRRHVPGIHEKNRGVYDLARRIAINTMVQGSQAELMKIGMLALDNLITAHQLTSKLVLQIHDELIVAVPDNELALVPSLVTDTLQNVVTWNVPLLVTSRTGKDWQEVTK